MTTIKFKQLRDNFKLPEKSFSTDACFDVVVHHIEKLGHKCICYLGFSTEIPIGWKGVIVPRSSITKTNWTMLNSPGQVDSSYRGEWQVRFTHIDTGEEPEFPYKIGDRIAQIYFEKVNEVSLELVNEVSDTDRGTGGFGHTGSK